MITLSVHLMTYNNQEHLKETIDSILEQEVNFTYEIVISDDRSKDTTWNIVKDYKAKHPKLINAQQNKTQLGIINNYKTTLDRCKGTYVFSIAGDDYLLKKTALQQMVDVLKKYPKAGFIDSGFNKLYQANKQEEEFANKHVLNVTKEVYKQKLLLGKVSPTGLCFNRKHLIKHVNFLEYINMGIEIEDYPILVNLVMNTDFERISEPLVVYRIHEHSYSHNKTFKSQYSLYKQMMTLFNYFSNKYSFSEELIHTFKTNGYKHLLFLAGYFNKKAIGKDAFGSIEKKSVKDYLHYWASQSKTFRKLISVVGKIKPS